MDDLALYKLFFLLYGFFWRRKRALVFGLFCKWCSFTFLNLFSSVSIWEKFIKFSRTTINKDKLLSYSNCNSNPSFYTTVHTTVAQFEGTTFTSFSLLFPLYGYRGLHASGSYQISKKQSGNSSKKHSRRTEIQLFTSVCGSGHYRPLWQQQLDDTEITLKQAVVLCHLGMKTKLHQIVVRWLWHGRRRCICVVKCK